MQCLPKQLLYVFPAVGGAILTLIHLVFSLFQTFHKYLFLLKLKWLERTTHNKRLKSVTEEIELVSSEVKQFSQVPHHLVLILGTETISLKGLANLVVWSLAAGVSFVSIYDHKGSLKGRKDHLDQALQEAIGTKVYFIRNGYRNPVKNGSSMKVPCVSLLNASDGKELIVSAVRKLCIEASNGLITSGKPTQEELDEILIKETGLPEANLAIYFGSICSMYGFMPWHARITEFLPLEDPRNINVTQFLSVLRKYNKCEQRLGK